MSFSQRDVAEMMRSVGLTDGIVFKFPAMHIEHYKPMIEELQQEFDTVTAGKEVQPGRVKVFNFGAFDGPKIVKVSYYGLSAIYATMLSSKWFQYVDEVHHKVFLGMKADDAAEVLQDELFHSVMGRKARYTHNSAAKNKKQERSYGLAVGDKDSAYEFVIYRRGKEYNYGIEVRIKGKALEPLKEQARSVEATVAQFGGTEPKMHIGVNPAIDKAWTEFWGEMRRKAVDLGDYVEMMHNLSYATSEPTFYFQPSVPRMVTLRTDEFGDTIVRYFDSVDSFYRNSPDTEFYLSVPSEDLRPG